MVTSYTLNIQVDPNQLSWLLEHGYNLCIARQTNDSYNVIWQVLEFRENNSFVWEEEFRTFWAPEFREGFLVQQGSNAVPIGYGQNVVIKADGSMAPATGEINTSGKFTVTNNSPRSVNVGLQSKSGGNWEACYVSHDQISDATTIEMTPSTILKVWFQQNASRSKMITDIKGVSVKVVYEGVTTHKISYKGAVPGAGTWSLDS